MLEQIILGTVQGIMEWLPVSSEGMIVLLKTNVFKSGGVTESIEAALYLHMGTFFAALIYFWKDIVSLVKSFRMDAMYALIDHKRYEKLSSGNKILVFLGISTTISGAIGLVLLKTLETYESQILLSGKIVTFAIGVLLLVTGYLQLRATKTGQRSEKDLSRLDGILLGITQGLAVLPGFSRSGFTIAALLFRRFTDTSSLKLSFLMSLPIVLLGNIFLNIEEFRFSMELVGLVVAFVTGLISIHLLLLFARKVNFGLFVISFGVLTIVAALLS